MILSVFVKDQYISLNCIAVSYIPLYLSKSSLYCFPGFHQFSLPTLFLVLPSVVMVIGKTSCNDPAHPNSLVLKDLQFVNLVLAVPPGKIEGMNRQEQVNIISISEYMYYLFDVTH